MPICSGTRQVGFLECAGGGQIVVDGHHAFIGHMNAPGGTSIVDIADPARPKVVATINMPKGMHSHKVRSTDGIILVNREIVDQDLAAREGLVGGLAIYDVSNPAAPREIAFWLCGGRGVHRFNFDGRYAYISPEMEGYIGNIVMILDLADPSRPVEVGRWWMPGQWIAGGETPTWAGRGHRCHHALRRGNRLYVSYWHGGVVILDISDMSRPKMVSNIDWSPPYPWPTHTAVPLPEPIFGRRWMLCADEDVELLDPDLAPEMSAFVWMLDITDETRPTPVSSFQVDGVHGKRNPLLTGCHQPVEVIRGSEVPVAWFANGLRFIDISNPLNLRESAYFIPDPAPGAERVSSNDVFQDDRGLIYLVGRLGGLSIIERV